MFRYILKKKNPIRLGRWDTNKQQEATLRLIDLANCDSCGTCTVPKQTHAPKRYLYVDGDIVDIGYMPLPGSFDLYAKHQ